MKYLLIYSLMISVILTGCDISVNSPPLYQTRARDFLEKKGIEENLIIRLIEKRQLTAEEADQLSDIENIAVLHLLLSNSSISLSLIERFAKHKSFEVHTGLASNPKTPLKLLKNLRTPGKYTTLNDYISRNPNIPESLLWEMHRNGEASYTSLALNPNCPRELMAKIANKGNEIDRAWLATNPNLPSKLILQLEHDNSELVQSYLKRNPIYRKQIENSNDGKTR